MPDKNNSTSEAEELFATLRLMPSGLSLSERYSVIDRVFHLAVDQRLLDSKIRFAGFFAKVDYLLKLNADHMPDSSLPSAINSLRIRLKQRGSTVFEANKVMGTNSIEDGQLEHDIAALCVFIGLVYDVPVPDDLRRRYAYVRTAGHRKLVDSGRTLRVIVITANEKIITATREDNGEQCEISYEGIWEGSAIDRSYLKPLLDPGTQLNLVRPRQDDNGIVYAELIIVNPDCLIDISAIAACFDEYGGCSPYTYIINKVKPKAVSEPITLGNFASQLLDEAVYGCGVDFNESFSHFVRHNALVLAVCPVSDDFRYKAEEQRGNILRAINSLKENGQQTDCILEPSFFCEPLGLQGRMDFLTLDYGVVIEQKSGRAAYNPEDPDTPRARTSHYVQLLLYRALLHYGGYNPRAIFTYLLYSKYANSLLAVGNAPQLLFKALALRNQIAWMEVWLSQHGHFRMLERLTPERICPNGHGYGWEHFTRPQIAQALDAVRGASPVERAYYIRFMQFAETEQLLAKLGNRRKAGSGFASAWNDSLQERLAAGNIYERLLMADKNINDEGQVDAVTLIFANGTDTDISNFREGDIVVFYSYDPRLPDEPLLTRHIVFRGILTEIADGHLNISLRNPQTNPSVIKGEVWAVEHDFMESSANALYRGLQAFLVAPLSRRQLLLNQRKPEVDKSKTLNGDYTNKATGDKEFNTLVLMAKQASDYFLIIGPPGTGKTSYGMLNVLKEELTNQASSVLLMAYTNRAVDEMCQKLYDSDIDFVRLGGSASCPERFRSHLLDNRSAVCHSVEDIQQMIHNTRVFCGTTTAINSGINLLELKVFSLAIIDEASQILEPQIVGILSAQNHGVPSIKKFVLIGDEKQLPAVVQQSADESAVADELLVAAGITDCRISLFERLILTCRKNGMENELTYMLTRQGRMHPAIADFPNREFYGGKLKAVPLEHQKGYPAANDHLLFIVYTPNSEEQWHEGNSDKVNKREALIIAEEVWQAYRKNPGNFNPGQSVGVIVPYRNQVSTVRHAIEDIERRENVSGLSRITIDTVERFQGSQRDVIIYGFTVSHDYQLDFLTDNQYVDSVTGVIVDRKLNVAMTRAMRRLVMVGNPRILRKNAVFSRLLDYVSEKGVLLNLGS